MLTSLVIVTIVVAVVGLLLVLLVQARHQRVQAEAQLDEERLLLGILRDEQRKQLKLVQEQQDVNECRFEQLESDMRSSRAR